MNADERTQVGEYWLGLSQMYNRELTRMALKIMLDAVDDLPANEIMLALKEWSRSSKSVRCPLPGDIRQLLSKDLSIDAKANESANRIRTAITKFGWADPAGARAYMGELAWAIVERNAGWLYICENHGVELNPLTFHAQARDSAKAMLESASLGQYDQPIGIENKASKPMLEVMKLLNSNKMP